MIKKAITILLVFLFSVPLFAQLEFDSSVVMENINFAPNASYVDYDDVDGDGDLDIVSIDFQSLKWFENLNTENQDVVQHVITDFSGNHVTSVDIDGDGDLDMVAKNLTNIVWVEHLDGQGNFGEANVLHSTNNSNWPIFNYITEDVDSDGDMDILFTYEGNNNAEPLSWLNNTDGQGTFELVIIDNYADAQSIQAIDKEGDGDLDIIAVYDAFNSGYKIQWYINDGANNYTIEFLEDLTENSNIHVNDLDNDGDFDLVVASINSEKVYWLKNTDGLGTFVTEQTLFTGVTKISDIKLVDLDDDGDKDLLFSSSDNDQVSRYLNTDGQGNFDNLSVISSRANGVNGVMAVHFNDDNLLDIVSASPIDDKIAVYINTGGATYSSEKILTRHVNLPSLAITTDIDGDGDLDVVSLSQDDNKLAWYENLDGLGSYGPQHIVSSEVDSPRALVAADIDGDGDMDIISGDENSSVESKLLWYENTDGEGNFGAAIIIDPFSGGVTSLQVTDLDNDGDNDILFSEYGGNILWYNNLDGLGDFSSENAITSNYSSEVFKIVDVDADGFKDIVANSGPGYLSWFKNNGATVFIEEDAIYVNSEELYGLSVEDIDGDGDKDIVIASRSSTINDVEINVFKKENSSNNFVLYQTLENDDLHLLQNISIADINADGFNDLIIGAQEEVAWFQNTDGLGFFGSKQIIVENNNVLNSVFVADVDANGTLDVISATTGDYGSNDFLEDKIMLYKNLGMSSNILQGFVRLDVDFNGCTDTDLGISPLMIVTDNGINTSATFTLGNGFYQFFVEDGTYTTTITSSLPNYFVASPEFHTSVFNSQGGVAQADFCLETTEIINDVDVVIVPTSVARPGFVSSYRIIYTNKGTTVRSGDITLEYDGDVLSVVDTSEPIDAQTPNSLTFNYENLNLFETREIDIVLLVSAPPIVEIDDVLFFQATITPLVDDITEEDNISILNQIVVGAYDPNDIQCLEGDQILEEDTDQYLHYLIRFQNTGTFYATRVVVDNVLDDKLDWNTLQLVDSSHDNRVEILNGNEVSFIFNSIYLPASINDEEGSQGFILYKIKPKDNVQLGDIFYNTANIFFDFNPAIVTNTATTEIVDEILSIDENILNNIVVFPNPTFEKVQILSSSSIIKMEVFDVYGQSLLTIINEKMLNLSGFSTGVYYVKITNGMNAVKMVSIVKK